MSTCLASVSLHSLKILNYVSDNQIDELCSIPFETSDVLDVCWNHTNQVVATANADGHINLFHSQTGQMLSDIYYQGDHGDNSGPVHSISFSYNSRYMAQTTSSTILIWDLKKRSIRNELKGHESQVNSVSFFPDGKLASGDTGGSTLLWDLKSDEPYGSLSSYSNMELSDIVHRHVTCVRANPTGIPTVASGYSDGIICVYDTSNLSLIRRQPIHKQSLTSLAFSPKNTRLIASCSYDGLLCLTDTSSKPTEVLTGINTGHPLTTVSFHSDSLHTAVGTSDGKILVYDWRKLREPVTVYEAHSPNPVKAIAFQNLSPASSNSTTGSNSANDINALSKSVTSSSDHFTDSKPLPVATAKGGSNSEQGQHSTIRTTMTDPPIQHQAMLSTGTTFFSTEQQVEKPSSARAINPPSISATSNSGNFTSSSNKPTSYSKLNTAAGTETSFQSIGTHTSGHIPSSMSSLVSKTGTTISKPMTTASLNVAPPINTSRSSIERTNTVTQNRSVNLSSSDRDQTLKSASIAAADTNVSMLSATSDQTHQNSRQAPVAQMPTHYVDKSIGLRSGAQQELDVVSNEVSISKGKVLNSNISNSLNKSKVDDYSIGKSAATDKLNNRDIDSSHLKGSRHAALAQALQPVTSHQLREELDSLRFDIHKELQVIIREQNRQFAVAKEDTAELIRGVRGLLAELLTANKELREENERLRHIY